MPSVKGGGLGIVMSKYWDADAKYDKTATASFSERPLFFSERPDLSQNELL